MKRIMLGACVAFLSVMSALGVASSHREASENILGFYRNNFVQPWVGATVCNRIQVPKARLDAPKDKDDELFYLTNYKGTVIGVADNQGNFYGLVGKVQPHQITVKKLMMKSPKGLRIDIMCYPKE
ncbi:MAG: hypothetical protein A3F17_07065 [Gammaproteobacteria bacterium RIFCSPHIGHO2_12_FULL_41_15]|nr:MAG: hypothetical protein A3F17_07065 [Gammaproteobacteria bacterium RIFCSPHIGHO2_12_FULL_41_15]